ncbi:MAG: hypothetical protein ACK4YQ_09245 [Phenylobacterium sp.]|uniref:hypothetical protein n=1 Tax=Phenylobacterium sp. TaxID=1871053 RepID=UPI00391BC403
MDALDERMRRLFAEDEPPARDPAFVARVAEAAARRRLRGELAMLALASLAAAGGLYVFSPVLTPAVEALARQLAPVAAGLVLAAAASALVTGRFSLGLGLRS